MSRFTAKKQDPKEKEKTPEKERSKSPENKLEENDAIIEPRNSNNTETKSKTEE